jgi:fibronectin type 3 domain-containing protein
VCEGSKKPCLSKTRVNYILPPLPPTNLKGFQRANRFATQTDYVNILTWNVPIEGAPIVAYKIFRNKELSKLIAVISNQKPLKFEDHNRKKGKTYTYYIVSIDEAGNSSKSAKVKVMGQ